MNLIYLTIFIYKVICNIVLNGQKSLFLIMIWVCTKILAVPREGCKTPRIS